MVGGDGAHRGGRARAQALPRRSMAAAAFGAFSLLLRSGPEAFSARRGELAGSHRWAACAAPTQMGRDRGRPRWQAGKRTMLPPLHAAGNAWSLLGVSPRSTREQVKQAFRERIKKAHPDAGGSAEEFRQLQWAYKAALEQVRLSPGQTPSTAAAVDGFGSGYQQPPDDQGWSIHDFYRWRREQAQTEYDRWARDADWRGAQDQRWRQRSTGAGQNQQQEDQRSRQRWTGAEQGQRQEEAHRKAQEPEAAAAQAEFKDALRQDQARAAASSRARRRRGESRNRDLHKWDWDSVINRQKSMPDDSSAERSGAARQQQHKRSMQDGDTVVSHRVVETARGPVRVPVYQATSGTRYYHSPVTSQRVTLPR